MRTITYSYARQNLAATMKQVCDEHEPVLITRTNDQGNAVLMSQVDFDAMQEISKGKK